MIEPDTVVIFSPKTQFNNILAKLVFFFATSIKKYHIHNRIKQICFF
jgi:hypothetical protein